MSNKIGSIKKFDSNQILVIVIRLTIPGLLWNTIYEEITHARVLLFFVKNKLHEVAVNDVLVHEITTAILLVKEHFKLCTIFFSRDRSKRDIVVFLLRILILSEINNN